MQTSRYHKEGVLRFPTATPWPLVGMQPFSAELLWGNTAGTRVRIRSRQFSSLYLPDYSCKTCIFTKYKSCSCHFFEITCETNLCISSLDSRSVSGSRHVLHLVAAALPSIHFVCSTFLIPLGLPPHDLSSSCPPNFSPRTRSL